MDAQVAGQQQILVKGQAAVATGGAVVEPLCNALVTGRQFTQRLQVGQPDLTQAVALRRRAVRTRDLECKAVDLDPQQAGGLVDEGILSILRGIGIATADRDQSAH